MIENSEETKTLAQMFELMGIDNEWEIISSNLNIELVCTIFVKFCLF